MTMMMRPLRISSPQLLLPMLMLLLLLVFGVGLTQAQEEPSIAIPTFVNDTSLRARQNVCDRFRAYDRGEVELRLALEGLALRPLFTQESFFHLDENGRLDESYPGMVPRLMDELSRRAGFTWRQSFGVTNGPPPGGNKTWTDLLLWGTDYFDVYCDWYARTIDRLKLGVTFPQGFYDSSYILVGLVDQEDPADASIDLWQWLEPFDTGVWICIVITILVSGILYQLLDYIPPNHISRYKTPTFNTYRRQQKKKKQKKRDSDATLDSTDSKERERRSSAATAKEAVYEGAHTVGDGIFLSSLLFTQHFQFMPRTTASRVFSASMGLWALLISSNYTANLASFFVIENTPTIAIQSIDDAIQTGQFICVWGGTAVHEFMLKDHPKAKLIETDTEKDVYDGVRSKECILGVTGVSSFDRLSKLQEVNPDCNLQWVGRRLKHVPAGFSVKADAGNLCSSLINDVLNVHLIEMEADGFIDQAWKNELARTQDQDCDKKRSSSINDADSMSRSLKEMAGTFVIHLFFGVVAILVAIATRLYDTYNQMSDESKGQLLDNMSLRRRQTEFQIVRKQTQMALEREEEEEEEEEESTNNNFDPDITIPHNNACINNINTNTSSYIMIEKPIPTHRASPNSSRPESPMSYGDNNNHLPLEGRLQVMEQTLRRRQDELEFTVKEQMNTIVELLKEQVKNDKSPFGSTSTHWT